VEASRPAPLKIIAEPLRWRIINALAGEQLCVCHLTEDLGVPQPLISHHLRVLRDAGVVESEKWRYWTYYRLKPAVFKDLALDLQAIARNASQSARERRPCC
jgi:DNA-binding transcriptional ArsR family regulator